MQRLAMICSDLACVVLIHVFLQTMDIQLIDTLFLQYKSMNRKKACTMLPETSNCRKSRVRTECGHGCCSRFGKLCDDISAHLIGLKLCMVTVSINNFFELLSRVKLQNDATIRH
jgi:hypothetical protein